MDFYNFTPEQVLDRFKTTANGLSKEEFNSRLKQFGYNVLKKEDKIKILKLIFSQINSAVVYILIAAFVISLFLGEKLDSIVIGSIIVLNTALGFFQEYKAEKSIKTLKKFSEPKSFVIRNNKIEEIDTSLIVPGDIVILEAGNFVPADSYLIESYELKTDESLLTGESVPVGKRVGAISGEKEIGERENMVFSGTTVAGGRGKAIVVSTGMRTEVGKIAKMIQEDGGLTPLQKKLNRLGRKLGVVVVVIALIILFSGVLRGQEFNSMILVAMSIAVAAIPEGLPAVVTISLAFGVQKMLKNNVLVRKLSSVETLGSTTTICVPADTPIICNPSVTNISCVMEEDKVLGIDGNFHKVKERFGRVYHGNMVNIKPVGLPNIKITPEHPILVAGLKKSRPVVYGIGGKRSRPRSTRILNKEWISASEINKDHLVMVPRIKSSEEFYIQFKSGRYREKKEVHIDEKVSELLGWYLAEGCTSFGGGTGHVVFYFGKKEKKEVDRLSRFIEEKLSLKAYIYEKESTFSVNIINLDLANFLKNKFGTGASNKKIPDFILKSPVENIKAFLRGYLKGDGNVSSYYLRYWTTSRTIAHQLVILLAKIGIRARVHFSKRADKVHYIDNRRINGKDAYEIFISSTQAPIICNVRNNIKQPKKNSFLVDEDFVYYPIKNISKESVSTRVYNIETGSNTYCLPFVVHNCADKTGTLTQNKMTVVEVFVNDKIMNAKSNLDEASKFLETIYLSNNLAGYNHEKLTDPTDLALSNFVLSHEIKLNPKKLDEDPFTSEKKYAATYCDLNNKKFWSFKGSVEVTLKRSRYVQVNDEIKIMSVEDKKRILEVNRKMAEKALRIIAFAYSRDDRKTDMVFVGLTGMIDPPRKDVRESIEKCKKAGIKVIMITGDHKVTAQAISKQIGLGERVITGKELEEMDDETLKDRVRNTEIFARVNPGHKVRILKALKGNGEIVAMTGDGINDAPALKKADIGVAVGAGTDVAKESSDMVILDNNFSSIARAVEEGRGIYDNIKKFVNYLLSSNFGEVLILFLAMMIAFKVDNSVVIPLTAVQILWINLVTDGLPALALGVDNAAEDIMRRKPRDPKENIVDENMWMSIVLIGILMSVGALILFKLSLPDIIRAQTIVFTSLVVFELGRVYMIRSQYGLEMLSNKWLIGAVLTSIVLQLIVVYTPLRTYFDAASLGAYEWILIFISLIALLIFGKIGMSIIKDVTHQFD